MRLFLAIACLASAGGAQTLAAAFQNLDFEAASLPVIPQGQYGDVISIADGLPGWSALRGTNPLTSVLHNGITIGPAQISIFGPDWPYGRGARRIEGDYTVLLAASFDPAGSLALSQTGFVPFDARWLLFKGSVASASPLPADEVLVVSLDGQNAPIAAFATYPTYSLYGGDVSSFAGAEAELRFTVYGGDAGIVRLDSIVFSPVPEPGAGTVLVCGLLLTVCVRRWRFRDKRGRG
jgi:hypothetical protein